MEWYEERSNTHTHNLWFYEIEKLLFILLNTLPKYYIFNPRIMRKLWYKLNIYFSNKISGIIQHCASGGTFCDMKIKFNHLDKLFHFKVSELIWVV